MGVSTEDSECQKEMFYHHSTDNGNGKKKWLYKNYIRWDVQYKT